MANKQFIKFFLLLCALLYLSACGINTAREVSEISKERQTRDAIVTKSGTVFQAGSDPDDLDLQLKDAQNRLRTGGGLLGKKPGNVFGIGKKNEGGSSVAALGMPINPYLWKGSIETINFMPLVSADPFAGVIITDWYTDEKNISERCKLNIFIKGLEFKASNIKVNSFCQSLSENNNWIDQKPNSENNIKLENAILNKAKKIRLSQS
tara:strand:+ start:1296 stop:1919 length:624 start_codon:yes stop_codon:yes gene_type:complete